MTNVVAVPVPEAEVAWSLPDRGRVGMYGLIAAEAAIFTIFVVAYLFYVGKWAFTIALGAVFLGGTAREWHHLIYDVGLTIRTNLFGTSYYSLVGLHAFHVTVGLLGLSLVLVLGLGEHVRREHAGRLDVLSLYWHFVDAVWVVVFTVVYVIGR